MIPIQAGTVFEDQFVAPYLSRIFPWALNFECGGPEYPDFQVRDENDEDQLLLAQQRQTRWRRYPGAPMLTPQRHARNLARRISTVTNLLCQTFCVSFPEDASAKGSLPVCLAFSQAAGDQDCMLFLCGVGEGVEYCTAMKF